MAVLVVCPRLTDSLVEVTIKVEPPAGCPDRWVGGAPGREVIGADLDVGLDRRGRIDVAGPVRLEDRGED
jgi:hypothetical protein